MLFLVSNPPPTSAEFAQHLNDSKTEGKSLNTLDTGQSPNTPYNLDEPQIDQKFRDVLQFIADRSDVELKPPYGVQSEGRVHLLSEQFTPKTDFVSLTTTDAVRQFVLTWWAEFKKRDITPTSQRAIKTGVLFKASINKPSIRPYMSADSTLSIEPLNRPHINLSWLPQTGKKIELTDMDLQHFEKQARITIRVSNFLEALLQAWRYGDAPQFMLEKIIGAIVHATKTQLQAQTALLCQFIQLRRDLFMAGATCALDIQQALRHAPPLESPDIFPHKLLLELDDRVKRSCETSLIVQTYRKTQNQRQYDSKPKAWAKNANESQRGWGRSGNSLSPELTTVSSPPVTPPSDKSYEVRKDDTLENTGFNHPPPEGWLNALCELEKLAKEKRAFPVGGRLRLFWENWKAIGTPKRVYMWFRKGYRLPFAANNRELAEEMRKLDCPDFLLTHYPKGSLKHQALHKLIGELLTKQAIEEVPQGEPVVFNRVFLREKPLKSKNAQQDFRLIIDLTQINKLLKLKTFEMDTAAHIRRAITPNMWATSLDFSDAYHHIPIRKDFYRYLAFQVNDKKYWYKVCPFGLSPIPQVFTSSMEHLKLYARTTLDIAIFQYIDDWLLLFTDPNTAAQKTIEFAKLCISLGLLVNLDKSELSPTQQITHLGVEWNLKAAWVKPAKKQIRNITQGATLALKTGKARLATLESLRGKMVAAEKQTHLGRINLRMFQRMVTKALKTYHPSRWVKIPLDALDDLAWWSHQPNLTRGVPCVPTKPSVHITTDASDLGWGAHSEQRAMQGRWPQSLLNTHINHKELLAALRVIENWGTELEGETIQFWMDNLTAVSYISKQGGTRSHSMTLTAKKLFQLANSLNISIQASYIPGSLNVVADMYSRAGQILKTEWTLSQQTFEWVVLNNLFGQPQIDLFANRYTAKLDCYGSPCPDLMAYLVDALTADWPKYTILYAFPPTCIMDKVIVKIQQEKPNKLILLAPMHTKAAWFPFLSRWSKTSLVIPSNQLTLEQPHFEYKHPNPSTLCLTMFHIDYQN